MSIDENTAARVAKLARIKVEDEALPALASDFNRILGFIEQLNEVDVEGVEPMTSVTPVRLKRRDDVVTDGNQQQKVLANAPDAREGFFAVPKVVDRMASMTSQLKTFAYNNPETLHEISLTNALEETLRVYQSQLAKVDVRAH